MRGLLIAALLALSGCNTVASLHYMPGHAYQPASAAVFDGVVTVDQRKEAPHRLATIMGGFGNPLKTLDTAKPVKDEVGDAFSAGLNARGLLAPGIGEPFELLVTIRRFDADMIIGRTARIDLTMVLRDRAGKQLYDDSVSDSISDMKFFETGVLANIEDLQDMTQTLLNRTVNRMLDTPAFRDAITRLSGVS
jgi:hypothetical protein